MLDRRYPILFSDVLCHSSFKTVEGKHATSAGFVFIEPGGEVKTFGASGSLDMKPAKEDAGILGLFLSGILEPLTLLQVMRVANGVCTVEDILTGTGTGGK